MNRSFEEAAHSGLEGARCPGSGPGSVCEKLVGSTGWMYNERTDASATRKRDGTGSEFEKDGRQKKEPETGKEREKRTKGK